MNDHEYYSQKPLPIPGQATSHQGGGASHYNQNYGQGQQPMPTSYSANFQSPFDTVFDDHVYPASSHQSGASSSRQHLNSQHYQDTASHGPTRVSSEEDMAYNHTTDDIPLEDRSGGRNKNNDPEMQDHVYDAAQPQQKKSRSGRVSVGQLGMLGSNAKRIPFVVYFFTTVQIAVFIAELVKNGMATGSPIMIKPQFNPFIGPSSYMLINMGARWDPCMHAIPGVQNATQLISWPCPNTTTYDVNAPTMKCTLSDLCGFGGVPEPWYNATATMESVPEPNQWWRFITPMFLHAGVIHIGFNMLLQMTIGKEMERSIGSIRFFIVYVSAGIFGFVMGGNFAANGMQTTGASGALFGIIALLLLDLLYSWRDRKSPWKDLLFIGLDIVISFVLGLLPGLDNFAHIGGFLAGLALGICVLQSPNALRRRIGDEPPYSQVVDTNGFLRQGAPPSFFSNPVGFFKGRKPLWWAWWLVRAAFLTLTVVIFILLLNNFYVDHKECSWCKYLSCLPVKNWCEDGNLQITTQDVTPNKRDLIFAADLEQLPRLQAYFA
uniref:Rhomboid-type serine protease n=1 Tax=Neurospora crassa TaxID=5141 RepID=Q9HEF8_NEUCS|nr:related to membrane protein [Neurospora crassa]